MSLKGANQTPGCDFMWPMKCSSIMMRPPDRLRMDGHGDDAAVDLAVAIVKMVLPSLIDDLVGGKTCVHARHVLERREIIQRP
jgi:hypothetical protein